MNDYDKEIIKIIDDQVKILKEKKAEDTTIINTLTDFIPDVMCYLDSIDKGHIDIDPNRYPNFAYFAKLLSSSLN